MRRDARHWWYPLSSGGLDRSTVLKEAGRGTHVPLHIPPQARGLQVGHYVWFYSGMLREHCPVAVGVIQTIYKGTDDGKGRLVIALYPAASVWLNKNRVDLSTSRSGHAPRKAFQAVSVDDVRQLMDSGVAKYL